jgi:hypothetical protein
LAKINHPNNSVKADSFEDGDRMTPESLIQNHASAVMGVCLANTKNVHDAEDVMQEVFVKAISKFNTLRDPNIVIANSDQSVRSITTYQAGLIIKMNV